MESDIYVIWDQVKDDVLRFYLCSCLFRLIVNFARVSILRAKLGNSYDCIKLELDRTQKKLTVA